jgi:hypothetical protein
MFQPRHLRSVRRRGAILLVVLALLTLFSIVGLTFVLYAEAESRAARHFRESETFVAPDEDPEHLLAYFLGQLIYGTDNLFSGLRGHSLAETMYGFNADPGVANIVPFSGVGRLRYPFQPYGGYPVPTVLQGQDNHDLINYTQFGADGFRRYPERHGWRALDDPQVAVPGAYTAGSVSYTYPDANNLFLAAVRASDGRVLMPSFHRPYTSVNPANPSDRTGWRGFGPLDPNNPNWTSAAGKYLTLRPRPADHSAAFPYPEDGGDVKNLDDAPGGNDSIWLDLGFPVKVAPNGKKYKPLFATLIQDLDNRVNVNVHGNIRGTWAGVLNWSSSLNDWQAQSNFDQSWTWFSRAGSDQGWGPWEVNLEKVITFNEEPNPAQPPRLEARKLFLGANRVRGRYEISNPLPYWGNNWYQVDAVRYLAGGPFYARTNSNANPWNSLSVRLPGHPGRAGTFCFPLFNAQAYDNSVISTEGRNHPLLYNFLYPSFTSSYALGGLSIKDRSFPASNLEALLRYGHIGSPALTSDLFLLCERSFSDAKTRRLVTTHAFDLNRPGATAWAWHPSGATNYTLPAGSPFPTGAPLGLPPVGAVSGEFDTDWRSVTAALGRLSLSRDLPNYPTPNTTVQRIRIQDPTVRGAFDRAQQARQQLAREVFDVLRLITGAADPATAAPNTPEFDALRWLAQLAVNLVDFIDKDDYLTPFNWQGAEWVFGTELPRLVLNEAYAEITNHALDLAPTVVQATRDYPVRFWIELHNPLHSDSVYLTESGVARLQVPADGALPAFSAYQLVIAQAPNDTHLARPNNVLGDPDPNQVRLVVSDFTHDTTAGVPFLTGDEINRVQPASGSLQGPVRDNNGYYVIGPRADFPGLANLASMRILDRGAANYRSLEYTLPVATDLTNLPAHTLLLRRLACPYVEPNPLPGQPVDPAKPYNSYVTTDYLESVALNDAVRVDAAGAHAGFTAVTARSAHGRKQPYAAHRSQQDVQQPSPAAAGQPRHTFFQANTPRTDPFSWLVFRDRPLINIMELLHAPSGKPHELTQRFLWLDGAGTLRKSDHLAPWTNPNARIYRLFEFLDAGFPIQGVTAGGRSIGKINVNNIWDFETFNALCDARPCLHFTDTDVRAVYDRLVRSRTPLYNPITATGELTPLDRPFRGFAAPHAASGDSQYPLGSGLEDTFLRPDPANPGRMLFEVAGGATPNDHPFMRYELLTKAFRNLTTRSNVFAVWLTVGFFEVIDDSDSTRPPRLGAELGRAENRHVRHRMFAIVDRSNLSVSPNDRFRPGPRPFFMNTDTAVTDPGDRTINLPLTQGRYDDHAFRIKPNDLLTIDVGADQEVITVIDVNYTANRIRALFTKRHAAGVQLTNVGATTRMGNPGPQPLFDPHHDDYVGVVRHFSIIGR